MNQLKMGWIDFSKSQRDKVIGVINLLSDPGVIDELGAGVVRDKFADIFFPGTSTIQTRAKYFLIVPYLLYELSREQIYDPKKMLSLLYERELDLIEILKRDGTFGVIGATSGRKLRRKPSEIYWSGLKAYNIFKGGNMSLNEYAKVDFQLRNTKEIVENHGVKGSDDPNAHFGDYIELWTMLKPENNWRETLSMTLSLSEAEFLKQQIVSSYPESLFAFLLNKQDENFTLINKFEEISIYKETMSEQMQYDLNLAILFADFLEGIHIRYNVILSQGDEDNVSMWNEWLMNDNNYSKINLGEILIRRLEIKNPRLIVFFDKCLAAIKEKKITALDQIIINREKDLKGRKRSKLCNIEEFQYSKWVGIARLDYRFRIGMILIRDIKEGLGEIIV